MCQVDVRSGIARSNIARLGIVRYRVLLTIVVNDVDVGEVGIVKCMAVGWHPRILFTNRRKDPRCHPMSMNLNSGLTSVMVL